MKVSVEFTAGNADDNTFRTRDTVVFDNILYVFGANAFFPGVNGADVNIICHAPKYLEVEAAENFVILRVKKP